MRRETTVAMVAAGIALMLALGAGPAAAAKASGTVSFTVTARPVVHLQQVAPDAVRVAANAPWTLCIEQRSGTTHVRGGLTRGSRIQLPADVVRYSIALD